MYNLVMENVLLNVADAEKYSGQYVAMSAFEDGRVVASGADPGKALQDAVANGYPDPVLVYIPEKDTIYIY